ncbi:MAG: hypothetical protein Q9219_005103 [cf. Caloplaca sp. 3 TL-2023]
MAMTPTPHLRCALQNLKPQLNPIRHYHAAATTTFHLQPRTHTRNPHHRPIFHIPSPRFASDTTTHPASTHPSASNPAASNPASIPPATPNTQSFTHQTPSTTSTTPSSHQPLTWNTYLLLRRSRRRFSLIASLLTASGTTAVGVTAIQANIDTLGATLGSMFGLDPIIMLVLATGLTGTAGWLVGPFVGEGVFRLLYRRQWGAMAAVSLHLLIAWL